MRKIILFIASSLDGYIARPDGNIDWLTTMADNEKTDYGYSEFLSGISSIVMGRKTYSEVLGFGIQWPYKGIKTYVITANPSFSPVTPDTYAIYEDPESIVRRMAETEDKDIWLVGGGVLIRHFLNKDLIDRMIISLIPVILGEGIRLFPEISKGSKWNLSRSQCYSSGVISITYDKINQ